MTVQQLKIYFEGSRSWLYYRSGKTAFISQPSLSNSIKETEKEAGITIFSAVEPELL